MIYAAPGTPGAVVTFKPRYGNYIGGEFVPPVKGQYFTNTSPVNGRRHARRGFPRAGPGATRPRPRFFSLHRPTFAAPRVG
ncbi:hypothetical protein G039_0313370 [Pseudomonas aeruginosa VRFPA01]|nr:hypothetical protein G039_0313370 [Pseudomonas aeruginosa VRFPA01]